MNPILIRICNRLYRIKTGKRGVFVMVWEGSTTGGRWVLVCNKMKAIVLSDAGIQDTR